jgi:cobalt-zinc-cadmium efflux system outer membrane protein
MKWNRLYLTILFVGLAQSKAPAQQTPPAQQTYTWEQLKGKFLASNPTLQAARIGIEESHAQETTAYLRPNPDFTAGIDQIDPFTPNPYQPLAEVFPYISFDYLHERAHKRELRLESAKKGTVVAQSQLEDQQRNLIFNLRSAFVQTLQAKAVLALANENLANYDKTLEVSRDRKKAGDIAQVDLDRLELQRVQYESDLQTALVNLRTAKIQLLQLLNDRSPVERFDVTGHYDFAEQLIPLEELRQAAVEARPDLRAAVQSVDLAKTNYHLAVANGSTDPTFGIDFGRNPPISAYMGVSMNIPLRIFDRNQGEKARTELDIKKNQRLQSAAEAQVFSDVDSAYATVNSNVILLRSYKSHYLDQAVRVRQTISFAYQHGGASLLDYLQAEQDYRSIQLNYLNLIGSYLTAAGQLNLAVGREVIQ